MSGGTVAVVQARMSSSRLPGKVLMEIGGKPAIVFMAERLSGSHMIDRLVVATSEDASDDVLATTLQTAGIECFRGSLDDVLERFLAVATYTGADHLIRLTGDCPLIDVDIVDAVIGMLIEGGYDYVSNVDPPSFPDGLDAEAFTAAALIQSARDAELPSDREHVTQFMLRAENGFSRGAYVSPIDLSSLRWTIDYADDLDHVRRLVESVPGDPVKADRFDFLRASDRNRDMFVMAGHQRNEGLAASLAKDGAAPTKL